MPEFLQPSFWLTLEPPIIASGPGRLAFVVFALMVGLGIAVRVTSSRRKEDRHVTATFKRIGRLLTTMGVLGLLLAFMGYEGVRFLGARFWYPVWLLATALWAYVIYRFVKKQVPEMRRKEHERRAREKYFPKRRK